MDVSRNVAELKSERQRLDQAIAALEGLSMNHVTRSKTGTIARTARPRRHISAAARKRLSALLKARWAAGKMGKRKKTA